MTLARSKAARLSGLEQTAEHLQEALIWHGDEWGALRLWNLHDKSRRAMSAPWRNSPWKRMQFAPQPRRRWGGTGLDKSESRQSQTSAEALKIFYLVPGTGLEPARLAATASKTVVYAIPPPGRAWDCRFSDC